MTSESNNVPLTSGELHQALGTFRDNDLRVRIAGCHVPVRLARYEHRGDFVVIELDDRSEEFLIMTARLFEQSDDA